MASNLAQTSRTINTVLDSESALSTAVTYSFADPKVIKVYNKNSDIPSKLLSQSPIIEPN